VIDLLTGY